MVDQNTRELEDEKRKKVLYPETKRMNEDNKYKYHSGKITWRPLLAQAGLLYELQNIISLAENMSNFIMYFSWLWKQTLTVFLWFNEKSLELSWSSGLRSAYDKIHGRLMNIIYQGQLWRGIQIKLKASFLQGRHNLVNICSKVLHGYINQRQKQRTQYICSINQPMKIRAVSLNY